MSRKYDKESLIGTKKGIYTLVENINTTHSLFKCELCGKIYKASFYDWYHSGRKVCDCMFKTLIINSTEDTTRCCIVVTIQILITINIMVVEV